MNWIKAIQKTVFLAVLIALVLTLGACGKTQTAQSAQPATESAEAFTKVRHAEITVKDYGTIKL